MMCFQNEIALAHLLSYPRHNQLTTKRKNKMKSRNLKTAVFAIAAITFMATAGFTNAQGKGPNTNPGNHGALFIDANGDGICDNFNNTSVGNPGKGNGKKNGTGKGFGMKNGNGSGVCDGTGRGSGKGGGVCDGTGPKGNGKGRGNK
jgi:hypothetical protein